MILAAIVTTYELSGNDYLDYIPLWYALYRDIEYKLEWTGNLGSTQRA